MDEEKDGRETKVDDSGTGVPGSAAGAVAAPVEGASVGEKVEPPAGELGEQEPGSAASE